MKTNKGQSDWKQFQEHTRKAKELIAAGNFTEAEAHYKQTTVIFFPPLSQRQTSFRTQ
ncbi:hypothetical protein FACS1894181_04090 [Bacteroidia bacterium]|nr:hypothetical protein FACS1894181_04090 [Bacteroidia bacterium]